MESWDDDDFNPDEQVNSRMAEAAASLGLNEKPKQPPEPEASKPATKKPSATSLAAKAAAKSGSSRGELSKAEILEMQQRGELEVFADLLGVEVTEKKYGELETKLEFTDYARKAANAFQARSDHPFYSDFAYTLIDALSVPLNAFQLSNVVNSLNDRLKLLKEQEAKERVKEEEAAKQAETKKPKAQQKKKKPNTELLDDCLDDEYDHYTMQEY